MDGSGSQNALLLLGSSGTYQETKAEALDLFICGCSSSSFHLSLLRLRELTLPWFLFKLGNHLCSQVNTGSASVSSLPFNKQNPDS